jgi:hypothetical protein
VPPHAVEQFVQRRPQHDAAAREQGDLEGHVFQVGQDVRREHHRRAAVQHRLDPLAQEVAAARGHAHRHGSADPARLPAKPV